MKKNEWLKIEIEKYRAEHQSELNKIRSHSLNKYNIDWSLGIYIDYSNMSLDNLNQIINTLESIYHLVYSFYYTEDVYHENIEEKYNVFDNIRYLIKSHPEDDLSISSIETGNSITFRIKTGWTPKIESKKNDIVIALPKGIVALSLVGLVVGKSIDYGISNFQKVLTIIKTQKEIEIQDEQLQKIQLEVKDLLDKIETKQINSQSQELLNIKLNDLHELTTRNKKITAVQILPGIKLNMKDYLAEYNDQDNSSSTKKHIE